MFELLIHPDSHAGFKELHADSISFLDGSELPVIQGTPILFSTNSVFDAEAVKEQRITTQNAGHLDTSDWRNRIRRNILPSLAADFNIEDRYAALGKLLLPGSRVLIIGTGEKSDYYRKTFSHSNVITSDVHNHFKPDIIFDGHFIPFKDESFDLILAAQVIEHTINPWKFSAEMRRVTKTGGYLQVEAPHNFPYHAEPYDFFRFTYTGLRVLFPDCRVISSEVTEGNAANVAVTISNFLINTSSRRLVRSGWLFTSRLTLGWLKYLDGRRPSMSLRAVSMPKGYAFTFQKDMLKRSQPELLSEFYKLKK